MCVCVCVCVCTKWHPNKRKWTTRMFFSMETTASHTIYICIYIIYIYIYIVRRCCYISNKWIKLIGRRKNNGCTKNARTTWWDQCVVGVVVVLISSLYIPFHSHTNDCRKIQWCNHVTHSIVRIVQYSVLNNKHWNKSIINRFLASQGEAWMWCCCYHKQYTNNVVRNHHHPQQQQQQQLIVFAAIRYSTVQ